jgi:nucleotide sugar dehydrogenase
MNLRLTFKNVCVAGLGQVGLPTAEYIKNKGLRVWGYDIAEEAVVKAKSKGIIATTDFRKLPHDIDVYVICVSTTLSDNKEPDLSAVFDVCEKIAESNNASSLISIESTIIPGTTRKIFRDIFDGNAHLVHVPHRYWSGDPIRYGVRQLRIIGALNDESLKMGLTFYKNVLDIPLHVVSSVEIAELCKIAENAYRYMCIAFAEELRMICEELGLDFGEVREACNTKWNVNILEARDGIGGHCLPKDTYYLIALTKYNTLLKAATSVDRQYREWLKHRGKGSKSVLLS